MLKPGQEQDNFFEIIEKGNFFTPTKGEDNSEVSLEKGTAHNRTVRILKTVAWILGIVGFVILGYVVISDYLLVN